MQKLSNDLEDYMEDFWMKLEDREDVLTELLEQVRAEKGQLETRLQLKDDECFALSETLSETEMMLQQREEELARLKEEIAEVEQAQADDMVEASRAKHLRHECEILKADISAKTTLASELQIKLQKSESDRKKQIQEHARSKEKLQELLKQQEEDARAVQTAAVEIARQEVMHDMDKAKENIQMLLTQAEEGRATLQDELNAAKQKISFVEEKDGRVSATVGTLESELQTAQSRAASLGEEVNQNDADHHKVMGQHLALIRDLEAKLADKETAVAHLSRDSQVYKSHAQEVLTVLKGWARKNQAIMNLAYELAKAEKGDLKGINPELQPLFQMDIIHKAIFQYCQARKDERHSSGNQAVQQDIWAETPLKGITELVPMASSSIVDKIRRVILRSPSGKTPSPRPPSVQTEQEWRRTAGPPRSIIKFSTHSTPLVAENEGEKQDRTMTVQEFLPGRGTFTRRTYSQDAAASKNRQEEGGEFREPGLPSRGGLGRRTYSRHARAAVQHEEQEVQKDPAQAGSVHNHGLFNRGPYNRLVAGIKSRADNSVAQTPPQKMKPVEDPSGQSTNTGEVSLARVPHKRKQVIPPQELELPGKRTKIGTKNGKSSLSTPHFPPEQGTKHEQDIPVPSAPRKTHKAFMLGNGLDSPTRHCRGSLGGNEESQDPMSHSKM